MNNNPKIAVVATGDEIIEGDVINSNGANIASMLNQAGFNVTQHLAVRDKRKAITNALQYLMQSHQIIITIGGLGPTCDDITRESVAEASQHPLEFSEENWKSIQSFFKKHQRNIPEGNQQQAFFPKHAIIIPNHRGTAAGCLLYTKNNTWLMLPGPPSECLVMMEKQALPQLIEYYRPKKTYRHKWLLLGASESHIAEKINQLKLDQHTEVGYRCHQPYLDIKIKAASEAILQKDQLLIESIIDCPLCTGGHKASDQLLIYLKKNNLSICDDATGGVLQSLLSQPTTKHHLDFNGNKTDATWVITGLSDYWLSKPAHYTYLQITQKKHTVTIKIRNKPKLTPHIAAELICHHIITHA